MIQVKAGVIKLSNGLFYFGPSCIASKLQELGLSPDEASSVVGSLVSDAVDADQLFSLRTLTRPQ